MSDRNSHRTSLMLALVAAAPLALSGCADTKLPPLQIGAAPAAGSEPVAAQAAPRAVEPPARAVRASGSTAAIAEARRLRQAGDRPTALARLDAAAASAPGDLALSRERGLLALELGQLDKAESLLQQAIDPTRPDWRIHSALGAALSAKGRQADAQMQLARALELSPEEPAVLNNLALSYALDGKQREAEGLLRRAASKRASEDSRQRVRQNLALLVGLSGRVDEAKTLSDGALPPEHVAANVAFLREQTASSTQVSSAGTLPTLKSASASASASASGLPAPTYQLGGPKK